ncbi:UvrD-helicase domain-containing protein [Pseudobutyrivibrio ruminis]|uniref:UvrD-helicase domain-containing protein n=1 Tax=Pseudobutyrivibrio ruminis TaxID=46206 RepID=UPI0003F599CA|nr:ATP-dependent helicase [Pseudobutyrivibrio ruminis]
MEPLYSILLCNQSYAEYEEKIKKWLESGIKVIWFTQDSEKVKAIKASHKAYADIFLFQAYSVPFPEKKIIIDGDDEENFVEKYLEPQCPLFNSAQYLVEHCKADEHIVVQASAGTGKTTVMIDRILYLMHTQPGLHLPEIYMITFTNDATNQMNKRLQDALVARYELTRKEIYLRWLEEQSQMNISTIHSFAYQMLREYGIGEGFTKNLNIRSYKYEKAEIIKNALDGKLDDTMSIKGQLGIPFYRANGLLTQYWSRFLQLGVSHSDMEHMDWGTPADKASAAFHKAVTEIIPKLDDEYFDIKRKNEGVGLDDIMRDLQEVLKSEYLPSPDISMKYLFIDEFQDSDLSQIMVACYLVKLLGATLFVVGDVKQSIYRFRGANEQAFDILRRYMFENKIKDAVNFELVNNYRTSASVLRKMDQYFRAWGKEGYLQYDKAVIPFNQKAGICKMLLVDDETDDFRNKFADLVSQRLNDLERRVEDKEVPKSEKTRVVLLTRTHKEVSMCASLLRRNKIPASVREDGSFFASEAVRDFYILVTSFMFPDEPKHIFNYLLTPYAGDIDSMDVNAMEMLHGDYDNLVDYLNHFLDQTNWKQYHKDMRLKPVLSVFKEILDDVSVIDNYIINRKAILTEQGWEEKRCNAQTFAEARQYQANLEKLMEIIQRNLGGEKVSIYDVYNFLKLNVATNRSESEAEVQSVDDYTSVLIMTVHKAKGLEFDTVFVPYTKRGLIINTGTEILVDPLRKKVSWAYNGDKKGKGKRYFYEEMQSSYYDEMRKKEDLAVLQEETRILYVAMTRAINHFICFIPKKHSNPSWGSLLAEVGVDYE